MQRNKLINLSLILFLILSIFCGIYIWQYYLTNKSSMLEASPSVSINNTRINVEIADSPEEHIQGLSDRTKLCSQCGMLFIFSDYKPRTFVMRRMHFPLDIIWIDDDEIVKIDAMLPPEGTSPREYYNSEVPVNYVLEVNGGFAREHNIKVGDKIILK